MKTLQFRCTLLSDVILNAQAKTSGNQDTLDFIPGGNFLGIVAQHYEELGKDAMEIFHSGHVRFGDAHPEAESKENCRTLHAPLSWYAPKGKSIEEVCYLHHFYDRDKDHQGGRPQQLKQCRKGYYAFDGNDAYLADVPSSFAIKSAYDRKERRSKDEAMFGYSSIDAGVSFLFSVETDRDELAETIKQLLVGEKHIGRSRTAQYGLVKIEEATFEEPATGNVDNLVYVYADSRLIFMDDEGNAHFRPSAEDLGLDGGKIVEEKTQVRTFQYAPWNYKRQCRDTDRCGIEKGSVFVVANYKGDLPTAKYVGSYQNEGFGRVIYNPSFLLSHGENGLSSLQFVKKTNDKPKGGNSVLGGTPLLDYLCRAKQQDKAEKFIYEEVNGYKFFSKNKAFASQWGKIRSIAMQCKTAKELRKELFEKEKAYYHHSSPDDPKNEWRKKPAGYLNHGVAAKKWKEGNGKKIDDLKKFISKMENSEYGDISCAAVVNLASYIAKQIKKN